MAAVVVVGDGLAGLAAAARLARQRHDVTLLACRSPGEPDPRLDEPGSITLPAVYRDLFRKTGRPLDAHVELVPVDPARRYVFPDGRVLDLPTGSRAAMLEAFGGALGSRAANEWDAFVAWGGALWTDVRPLVVPEGEAPGSSDRRAPAAGLQDPANRLVLDWYAIDAGADPARAPAELAVLPYLEQAFGAWQVDGGLAALATATAQRAVRCGARIETSSDVTSVIVRDGKVSAVGLADGSTVRADVVVDTEGLPVGAAAPSRARPLGAVVVAVRLHTPEPPDLAVETVLLPPRGGRGVVVVRPDVTADPTAVVVRATVQTAPGPDQEADMVRELLDTTRMAGVVVTGDLAHVSVRPARAPARGRRWTRRAPAGWLDLRNALVARDVEGLLRASPEVTGALAVPWQGLAAALAAHACGTVPRGRAD